MMCPRWLRLSIVVSMTALALITGSLPRTDARQDTYVVRTNDTLSAIAQEFGTTVSALMAANHLSNPDGITVGQVLQLQGSNAQQRYGYRHYDGRRAYGYGRRDGAATSSPATSYPPSSSTAATGAQTESSGATSLGYTVQAGDTLSRIAARFGLSEAALIAANSDIVLYPLRAGLFLRLPIQGSTTAQSRVSPLPANTNTPNVSIPASSGFTAQGTVEALLTAQAQADGVSVALVKAVAWQESGWRMVTAYDGGIGVMQLMPATVAWIASSSYLVGTPINPENVVDNIRGGVALLRYYLTVFNGNQSLAIAAYNEGLRNVESRGILASTARYVANVLSLEQRFSV